MKSAFLTVIDSSQDYIANYLGDRRLRLKSSKIRNLFEEMKVRQQAELEYQAALLMQCAELRRRTQQDIDSLDKSLSSYPELRSAMLDTLQQHIGQILHQSLAEQRVSNKAS